MTGPVVLRRWLEPVGNGRPRKMAVKYRTRLTDLLAQKEGRETIYLFHGLLFL